MTATIRKLTVFTIVIFIGCIFLGFLNGCAEKQKEEQVGCKNIPFISVHALHPTSTEIHDSLMGKFIVGKKKVNLKPPVNWNQDPYNDRSWRFWLHSLVFLEPLLQYYSSTGDKNAFEHAVALSLDWIDKNKIGTRGISEFAWYDMAVGARAAYLGFILKAGVCHGLLNPKQNSVLTEAALNHGRWLADSRNYKSGHNHGLYEDAGLLILARQCPDLPNAHSWAKIASRRFQATVKKTVQWQEGIHLEHSPAYHFVVTNLINRFCSSLRVGGKKLSKLAKKMKLEARWFVMPDGLYPQVGDTDLVAPPRRVFKEQSSASDFSFFPKTGAAIYKSDQSYLMYTAWYHSAAHKHSDELSFVWEESRRRIIIDSGKYGYYYNEPGRKFAESARAHNTLVIGNDFTWRGKKPYGSGLLDAKKQAGWFAVLGHNPLLKKPLQHHRTLLYKPGFALLILDEVNGAARDTLVTRRLHFAPGFSIKNRNGNLVARDPVGLVWLLGSGKITKSNIIRGRKESPIQGFTFPANRVWQKNSVLEMVTTGDQEFIVYALVLDRGESNPPTFVTRSINGVAVIELSYGTSHTIINFARNDDRIDKLTIQQSTVSR